MIEESISLKDNFSHALFVDTDVIPEDGFVQRLAKHNEPIVSGVYYDSYGYPVNRLNKKPVYSASKRLMSVDVFSMGLSLIDRKVLEKVQYPEPDPHWKPDADIEFCKKVKEAGFDVKQDFSIEGKHLLLAPFDGGHARKSAEIAMEEINGKVEYDDQQSVNKRDIDKP